MSPIFYDKLAVTTIKIGKTPTEFDVLMDGDEIEFTKFSPHGKNVIFMKDIVSTDGINYKAKFVSKQAAADLVKSRTNESTSALFCVHGFNVQPGSLLRGLSEKYWGRFERNGLKYYPVPVLWACNEKGLFGYKLDQGESAMKTGKGLKAFVDDIDNSSFPRKSLLMHSMGNHLVFDGACGSDKAPDADFENIFLVAADIPYDVFSDDPYEGYYLSSFRKKFGGKMHKAANLFSMLGKDSEGNPKGKIYIVHNRHDLALVGSSWFMNWESRIGSVGGGAFKKILFWRKNKVKIRTELREYIENKDFSSEHQKDDKLLKHSYQFEEFAVKFYSQKAI